VTGDVSTAKGVKKTTERLIVAKIKEVAGTDTDHTMFTNTDFNQVFPMLVWFSLLYLLATVSFPQGYVTRTEGINIIVDVMDTVIDKVT
jgi:hypothetical protein